MVNEKFDSCCELTILQHTVKDCIERIFSFLSVKPINRRLSKLKLSTKDLDLRFQAVSEREEENAVNINILMSYPKKS